MEDMVVIHVKCTEEAIPMVAVHRELPALPMAAVHRGPPALPMAAVHRALLCKVVDH